MADPLADPALFNASFESPVQRRQSATRLKKVLVGGVVILLLVSGLITRAFAHQGLIFQSSGTCNFSKEPEPCEQYVSPCEGAEYFYFPAQGVLRTRDNRIVEVDT